MTHILAFRPPLPSADRLWAVIAWQGKHSRIAAVHANHPAAQADCEWRRRQVREYRLFLEAEQKVSLRYDIQQIRRSDLPQRWSPLPALGFLRGQEF